MEEALMFVGNTDDSGRNQLEILKSEGLQPHHTVLEFGCGVLHLARYLVPFLEDGRYCGVDPNDWLREEVLAADLQLAAMMADKGARFSKSDEFDGSSFGEEFDFVFSHSVLSHSSHEQFFDYQRKVASVLRPRGVSLASFRMAEDSHDPKWVYPGVSFYSQQTMHRACEEAGLECELRSDIRDQHSYVCPAEVHDWMKAWPAVPGANLIP